MPIVTLKEILAPAQEKNYGVAAFDTIDFALTEGIIEAAEQTGKPLILMFGGMSFGRPDTEPFMTFTLERIKKCPVPICFHLDHGQSVEECFKAIHLGASSVMFDGSKLPIEENIAKTREVVRVAHSCDVSVEAEIGHVGAAEGNTDENTAKEDMYTNPEDAVMFVKETGIDALAIAFGTVHGVYKGDPKLDFERLKKIRTMVDVPLVMHGGSGLPASDFKKAIECGISKINFFTGMSRHVISETRKLIEETDGKFRHIKFWDTQLQAVIECAKEQLELFGTMSIYP